MTYQFLPREYIKACRKCGQELLHRKWGRKCISCEQATVISKPVLPDHPCGRCGKVMVKHAVKFCPACIYSPASRIPGQIEAINKVGAAVRKGLLKPARELDCVDCGGKAKEYDHRDYNKPLEVEPVCHGCNLKRGSAIPLQVAA